MDRTNHRPGFGESLLYLYLPFLAALTLTFASVTDDPFITLRYAANLVHGYGLAFNQGQHVQGFTSPLHLLVAVVAYVLPGGHDLFKLKLASLLFGILSLREASLLAYGIAIPRWAKRLACVAFGGSWIIGFASANALESTLEVWLLIAIARRLILNRAEQSAGIIALMAFAAVLTRLDSLIPLTGMALVGLLVRSGPLWLRVRWFGGALVGFAVTIIGELVLFGSLLPNTYYAKDLTAGRAFSMGWRYLVDPLVTEGSTAGGIPRGIFVAVFVIQCAFAVAGIVAIARHFKNCAYLLGIIVGQVLFILHSGSDWMHGGRFAAPMELPLILIDVLGVVEVARVARSHLRPKVAPCLAVIAGLLILAASFMPLIGEHAPVWKVVGVSDRSLLGSGQYEGFSQLWSGLPSELNCLRPGQLVAATEVGFLGFSNLDVRILDLRGLTDTTIAKTAPPAVRWPWGVDDLTWFSPESPVGRVIVKQSPALIASFDTPPPATVLGDRYHLIKTSVFGNLTIYLYAKATSVYACLRKG
jgi:hypothetical protein